MKLRRALFVVVALLALAGIAQLLYWAPQLPARVASHFDLSDRVNGWMERTSFIVLAIVLQVVLAAVFIGLPLLIDRLPDAFINVPDKAYWLAPERRAETLAQLSCGLLTIGAASLLLVIVIFQGVYALNAELLRAGSTGGGAVAAAGGGPQLVLPIPFQALMGLYLGVVAAALASMLLRFRKRA